MNLLPRQSASDEIRYTFWTAFEPQLVPVIGSYPIDLISFSFCIKFSSILAFRKSQIVVIFFIYQIAVNIKNLVAT
jgi:hypothetical protein